MKPRGVGEGVFADGEFGSENNGADGEHEDAGEISQNGERGGAGEEDEFLPPVFESELRVEGADHHEREEAADAGAGVCDIDGEFLSGWNSHHGVGRRENAGAVADDIDADEVEDEHGGVGHDEAEGKGDVVVKEGDWPREDDEEEGKGEEEDGAPAEQEPDGGDEEELERGPADILDGHAVAEPEEEEREKDEREAEGGGGFGGEGFALDGVDHQSERTGEDDEAVLPVFGVAGHPGPEFGEGGFVRAVAFGVGEEEEEERGDEPGEAEGEELRGCGVGAESGEEVGHGLDGAEFISKGGRGFFPVWRDS